MHAIRPWPGIAAALILTACGQSHDPATTARAQQAAPADAQLDRLYQQTCRGCHTQPASGAPLTGDAQAWAPRLAQGEDVLLDHTINGFGGMPPLGSCMDCSEDDFLALIQFMAGGE